MNIKLKRVYETPEPGDGYRILVDRLWPRGISKEAAAISLWLKNIAPSTELRRWYGHSTERWQVFRRRYLKELEGKEKELEIIHGALKREQEITLVYSARDTEHNQAVVLKECLIKPYRTIERNVFPVSTSWTERSD